MYSPKLSLNFLANRGSARVDRGNVFSMCASISVKVEPDNPGLRVVTIKDFKDKTVFGDASDQMRPFLFLRLCTKKISPYPQVVIHLPEDELIDSVIFGYIRIAYCDSHCTAGRDVSLVQLFVIADFGVIMGVDRDEIDFVEGGDFCVHD